MAGGGKDGPFVNRTPEQLAQKVRETEEDTAVKTFETELSGLLNGLLASANSRDVELVKDRLGVIKGALSGRLEKTIDSLFGGSVARHTYVDGLSDVDSLLILNETALEGVTPAKAIEKIADIIKGASRR
jgi:tRNA nucleotidyltransferase (CCA-adding enzyme)